MHGWIGTREFVETAADILRRLHDTARVERIAAEAARRHNDVPPRPGMPTCRAWCGGGDRLEPDQIIAAVRSPRPCSRDDWLAWSGDHRGNWYNPADQFVDHAIWSAPVEMISDTGILAILQPVHCYTEEAGRRVPQRRGWNATLADRAHAIGWDPKQICDRGDPRAAVHVGFPFASRSVGDARRFIFWVLCREAFLECVDRANGRRSSTRVVYRDRPDQPGFGQWEVRIDPWLDTLT
jgi:hypothetical protein